jgi:hypothetical protein
MPDIARMCERVVERVSVAVFLRVAVSAAVAAPAHLLHAQSFF